MSSFPKDKCVTKCLSIVYKIAYLLFLIIQVTVVVWLIVTKRKKWIFSVTGKGVVILHIYLFNLATTLKWYGIICSSKGLNRKHLVTIFKAVTKSVDCVHKSEKTAKNLTVKYGKIEWRPNRCESVNENFRKKGQIIRNCLSTSTLNRA